jgi:NhaP-type Na+/H+ or K+/H+ antiporter
LVIVAVTVLLVGCFIHLFPRSSTERINPAMAVVCGAILGAGTTVLTRIARRARQNKGLD